MRFSKISTRINLRNRPHWCDLFLSFFNSIFSWWYLIENILFFHFSSVFWSIDFCIISISYINMMYYVLCHYCLHIFFPFNGNMCFHHSIFLSNEKAILNIDFLRVSIVFSFHFYLWSDEKSIIIMSLKNNIHPFQSSSGNGGVGGFARVTATPVLYSLILSDVLIGYFAQ